MLSYSFDTGTTSGYVKAMEMMNLKKVLDDLVLCGRPATHPLLLPVLTLCHELSSKYDKKQREQRAELRKLEDAVYSARYSVAPAAQYSPVIDAQLELDRISKTMAICHTEILQRRPQAWHNVIGNVRCATIHFWNHIAAEKKSSELKDLHETLINRLDFMIVKLQSIENFSHVTIERLGVLREEVS